MTTQGERLAALETEIAELRDKLGGLPAAERCAGEVLMLTLALRLMQAGQPVPEGLAGRLLPDVGKLAPESAERTFTDAELLADAPRRGTISTRQPPGACQESVTATYWRRSARYVKSGTSGSGESPTLTVPRSTRSAYMARRLSITAATLALASSSLSPYFTTYSSV